MSEVDVLSMGVLIGAAAEGMAKAIGKASGGYQYRPKNHYLATPDRETFIKTHYLQNVAKLEDKYLLRSNNNISVKSVPLDTEHTVQSKSIHAISMFESISQVEPMAFVAGKKHKDAWEKIKSHISTMKNRLKTSVLDIKELEILADDSESLIRKIANDTHSLLAKAEEGLALDIVCDSMSSLSYRVKADGMMLLASKGDVSIRASVKGGHIKIDTTTFPGISCHTEIRRIEKDLEQKGLVLRKLCHNHMRLPEDRVWLKDLFPKFQVEKQNKNFAKRHLSGVERRTGRDKKESHENNYANQLIQQKLRQRDLNLIRR